MRTTSCPNCGTVFQISTQQLNKRGGKVRCGTCNIVFNAWKYLYEPKIVASPLTPVSVPTAQPSLPPVSPFPPSAYEPDPIPRKPPPPAPRPAAKSQLSTSLQSAANPEKVSRENSWPILPSIPPPLPTLSVPNLPRRGEAAAYTERLFSDYKSSSRRTSEPGKKSRIPGWARQAMTTPDKQRKAVRSRNKRSEHKVRPLERGEGAYQHSPPGKLKASEATPLQQPPPVSSKPEKSIPESVERNKRHSTGKTDRLFTANKPVKSRKGESASIIDKPEKAVKPVKSSRSARITNAEVPAQLDKALDFVSKSSRLYGTESLNTPDLTGKQNSAPDLGIYRKNSVGPAIRDFSTWEKPNPQPPIPQPPDGPVSIPPFSEPAIDPPRKIIPATLSKSEAPVVRKPDSPPWDTVPADTDSTGLNSLPPWANHGRKGISLRILPFVVLLSFSLAWQIFYWQRSEIVRMLPQAHPWYQALNIDIPAARRDDLIVMDGADLQADEAAKTLTLLAAFSNRASFPQDWPMLELTLTNLNDQPVSRRVFQASEYLNKPPDNPLIQSQQEVQVTLTMDEVQPKPVGYRVQVFYP